jgi:hypothetical protein
MPPILVKQRAAVISPSFVAYDVNHVLWGGQSLSVGAHGDPPLSTSQPYSNVMMNTGLRAGGAGMTSFVPMIEDEPIADQGETGAVAMSTLATRIATEDLGQAGHVILVTNHGLGSADYDALKQGTTPYSNGMAQVTAARSICIAGGDTHVVRGVFITHGETDALNDNPTYDADLVEWQADYQADVQAITGQTEPVPMFISQLSSWWDLGNDSLALQQLSAAVESEGAIVMVCPKYMFTYHDGVHLTGEGYRWLGEYYAKAYRRVILEGRRWEPVRPKRVTRSGAVVTAKFHVPVRPLVLDTTRVSDPGDYGFSYTSDGTPVAISSVQIVGPSTVQITLGSTPAGAVQKLGYAFASGASSGPTTGYRGCLRDSDPTESENGDDLFNWCVHFNETVTAE